MSQRYGALKVVVYSDDSTVRSSIVNALGRQIATDLPEHEIHEFATGPAMRLYLDRHKVDCIILDGEATPEGGLGIARQLKDEIFECPPVLVLVARADDAWLGAWSRADSVLSHPIDPFTFAQSVAELLRSHLSHISHISHRA